MQRYVIDIAYDGGAYAGWQKQPNALTVQEVLDKALSTVLARPIVTTGAGRTDAGVHASQLLVHFDIDTNLQSKIVRNINGVLPDDISVKALYRPEKVDFHTRFDAVSRAYTYHIILQKDPLLRHHALWVRKSLHVDRMQEAARALCEYEDFASFCKAHGSQHTTLCTMMRAEWEQQGHHLMFHIQANRFLRGMVRAVVGTLLDVGVGKVSMPQFREVIEAQSRQSAGANVAPHGLILTEVNYPVGAIHLVS